jgi:Lhr-like helicase
MLREGPESLVRLLREEYHLNDAAVIKLTSFFQGQECLSEIPDSTNCLVEIIAHDYGADCYFHTPLNRLGNDALARVAVHRLARDRGCGSDSLVADLGFALLIEGEIVEGGWRRAEVGSRLAEVFRMLLAAPRFEEDLDSSLKDSAALRERFQRVAQTGLMLLRQPLGQRRRVGGRDWAARRLFDRIQARDSNHVLMRQAMREARSACCDVVSAGRFVRDLAHRPIRCRCLAYPSPFVESWTQMASGALERIQTPAEALQRFHALLMEGADDARSE